MRKNLKTPKLCSGKGMLGKVLCLVVALSMVMAIMPGFGVFAEEGETAEIAYKIVPVDEIEAGNDYVLAIQGDNANKPIILWNRDDRYGNADESAAGRQWYIRKVNADNIYNIVSIKQNTFMEISGASRDVGAQVMNWSGASINVWQQWYVEPVDYNGETVYRLVNRKSGLCLQNNGFDHTLTQEVYTGESNQLFKLVPVGSTENDLSFAKNHAKKPIEELGKTGYTNVQKIIDASPTGADVANHRGTASSSSDSNMRDYLNNEWTWNGGTATSGNQLISDKGNKNSGVNIKAYNDINVLQFWTDGSNSLAVPFFAQKAKTEEGKRAVSVFEFYPSLGDDDTLSGEMAFYDDSHQYITSFVYGADHILKPQSADYTEETGKFSAKVPVAVTGEGTVEIANRSARVRVFVENKTDGTYTVEWYNETESGWNNFAAQTYEGSVYGLGRMEVYRTAAGWEHFGLGDFRVYSADILNEDEALDLGVIDTVRVGVTPVVPKTVVLEDETEASVAWNNYVLPTENGVVNLEGVITATGRKVVGTIVVNGKADDFITNYYSFNKDMSDEITGYTPTIEGSLDINTNGVLYLDRGRVYMENGIGAGKEGFTISVFYNHPNWGWHNNWESEYFYRVFELSVDQQNAIYYTYDCGSYGEFDIKASNHDYLKINGAVTGENINVWQNISVTVAKTENGGTEIKVYKNGNIMGETVTDDDIYDKLFNENTKCYIGDSAWHDPAYTGWIDDFKVYSIALTPEEIKAIASERPYNETHINVTASSALTAASVDNGNIVKDDLGIQMKIAEEYASGKIKAYGYTIAGQEGTFEADKNDLSIFTKASNTRFIFSPYVVLSNGAKVYGETYSTSLYEAVVNDIADNAALYAANDSLNSTRIANANKIIAKGGVLSTDTLDDVRNKIMTATRAEEGIITVAIKDEFTKFGIGFLCADGMLYVGSDNAEIEVAGDTATVYDTITIDTVNGTATLTKVNAEGEVMEAEVIYLDAVQLEFIQEIIEEIVADEVFEIESGSFEDIM